MLSFAGEVKLIDFGTARSAVDGRVTDTGVVVGRRSYVPPEAWEGEKVDHRADVFALGVVLWEVLTGRRAEEAPDPSLPDASTLNPDVTLLLGQVVARAMAPAPEDRYQSADEVAAALAAFVPPEADPRRDLADLLGLCFNVTLQKQLLADDIAEAKRFLHDRTRRHAPLAVPVRPSAAGRGDVADCRADDAPRAAASTPRRHAAKRRCRRPAGDAARRRCRRPAGDARQATVPTPRWRTPRSDGADCPPATDKRRSSPGPWLAAAVAAIVATSGIGLLRTHGRTARSRASAASMVVAPPPVAPVAPSSSPEPPAATAASAGGARPPPAFRQPTASAGSPAARPIRPFNRPDAAQRPSRQVAPPGQRSVGAREHARGLRAGAPGRGGRRRSPRARPARCAAHQHEELRRGGAGAGHRRPPRSPQRRGAQNVGAARPYRCRASGEITATSFIDVVRLRSATHGDDGRLPDQRRLRHRVHGGRLAGRRIRTTETRCFTTRSPRGWPANTAARSSPACAAFLGGWQVVIRTRDHRRR